MEFLANLLSGIATAASSNFTMLLVFDEPECPEELI